MSGCPHEAAPHRQPVANLGNEPGWPPVAPLERDLPGSGRLAASAESGTRRREDDPPGAATDPCNVARHPDCPWGAGLRSVKAAPDARTRRCER